MATNNPNDPRRAYYDHEPVYRRLKESGAEGWDVVDGSNLSDDAYQYVREFIASTHCPPPGAALDLGCGGGQVSLLLNAAGWRVFSTDYSKTAAEMAVHNLRKHSAPAHVFVSDATRTFPLADERFGLVVDNHVYHCIVGTRDRENYLSNIYRVLNHGGIYFATSMSAEGNLDTEARNIDPDTRIALNGSRFWATKSELEIEFLEAGFEILHLGIEPAPPDEGAGDEAVIYARKGDQR